MNEAVVGGVAVLMVVGLVGTLAPFVPGLPLIWGAGLLYGLLQGFGPAGWVAMAAITLLLVVGMVGKILLPHRHASTAGTPRATLAVGAVAGIVGFFVIPVVGLPLGAVAGVLLAEYRRTRDWPRARRATRDVIVGFGIGALVELGAGMAMVACWVVWVVVA